WRAWIAWIDHGEIDLVAAAADLMPHDPATLDERARDRRGDRARRRGVGARRTTPCPRKREHRREILRALAVRPREVLGSEAREHQHLLTRPRERDVEPALAATLRQRTEPLREAPVAIGAVADRDDHDVALVALR